MNTSWEGPTVVTNCTGSHPCQYFDSLTLCHEPWLTGTNFQSIIMTAMICIAICYCVWCISNTGTMVADDSDDPTDVGGL